MDQMFVILKDTLISMLQENENLRADLTVATTKLIDQVCPYESFL